MTAAGRFDIEAIKAALDGHNVLARFGVDGRGTREIKLAECPRCKQRQRRVAVSVNGATGDWLHHGGPGNAARCKGDAIALVAAFMGHEAVDRNVIEECARIAGISPDADSAELERIKAAHRERREARERLAADERARGEAMVPGLWADLAVRHQRGEAYLADRGLDPVALRQCGDVVRFYRDGSPAVQLRSFDIGAPINIARRRIDHHPGDELPKCLTLNLGKMLGLGDDVTGTLSTRGTLVGQVGDIDTTGGGADVAILTEGITDSLAALLAFGGCVVLGANGCGELHHVALAAAPRLVEARGWLLVDVHCDEKKRGVHASAQAMRVAVAAGLELRASVRAIDLGQHKDLADAVRAGWRYQWSGGAS